MRVWASGWQSHRFHVGLLQDSSEFATEIGIAIHQNVLAVLQESVEWTHDVPGDLFHVGITMAWLGSLRPDLFHPHASFSSCERRRVSRAVRTLPPIFGECIRVTLGVVARLTGGTT